LPEPGRRRSFGYPHREDKRRIRAAGNHFILSSSQQSVISAELTADALTIDHSSKGAADVSHMITFLARLDHEVVAR
jgi:hypothetical protein